MGVAPSKPAAIGEFFGDPPVVARLPRRRHGGPAHLDLTIGIRDRARLFVECRRRQDDIGEIGGFGKEAAAKHFIKTFDSCFYRINLLIFL